MPMDFLIARNGSTTIIRLPQTLVIANRQELKQLILDAVADGDRQFVLDLRDTAYVDSSGLGALVAVRKRVTEQGGEMWLANVNADLRQLLALTRLDSLLPLLNERDDDDGGAERAAPRLPRTPGPLSGSGEADVPPPTDFA